MSSFTKATKHQSKLRLAIIGPAGSGKTYSALGIAVALASGGKVAVIDTERGSASLYADLFPFDVLTLDSFSPLAYVEAIEEAEKGLYNVIVIDSLSHAWASKNGALEMVDKEASRSQSKNSYTAWRNVTPVHNRMVDAIIGSKAHMICTMRSKMEYVMDKDERGKTTIRKVGLQPIQREGLDYEFTIAGDVNQEHNYIISKSRCPAFADAVIEKPGAEFAKKLLAWLNKGAKESPAIAPPEDDLDMSPPKASVSKEQAVETDKMKKASASYNQLMEIKKLVADVEPKALAWLVEKKWLTDGQKLGELSDDKIKQILARPKEFIMAVNVKKTTTKKGK